MIDPERRHIVERFAADALERGTVRGQSEQAERACDPERAVVAAADLPHARDAAFAARHRQRGLELGALRIDMRQPGIGADPDAVTGIERERAHEAELGRRILRRRHVFDRAARGVELLDAGTAGADPDRAVRILDERRDRRFAGRRGIGHGCRERTKTVAVVTLQARLRADPQIARLILQQRGDRVLRKALVAADRLEVEVAAQRIGAGLCRPGRSQHEHETRAEKQAQRRWSQPEIPHRCANPFPHGPSVGNRHRARHARGRPGTMRRTSPCSPA